MRKITITLALLSVICLNAFTQTVVDLGWDWSGTEAIASSSETYIEDLTHNSTGAEFTIYPDSENELLVSCAGGVTYKYWAGDLYAGGETYGCLHIANFAYTDYIEVSLTDNSAQKKITGAKINGTSSDIAEGTNFVVLYSDACPFDEQRVISYSTTPYPLPESRNGGTGVELDTPEGCKSFRIYLRTFVNQISENPVLYEVGASGTMVTGSGKNTRVGYIAVTLVDDDEPQSLISNGDATNPVLSGTWNVDDFDGFNLDFPALTTIDFTAVADLSALPAMTDLNPNCLIYVSSESGITGTNIISFDDNETGNAGTITLQDGFNFCNIKPFSADAVSYTRTFGATNGWSSICLPFAADLSAYEVRTLQSGDDSSVTFGKPETIEANTPYLIEIAANAGDKTFNGVAVEGKVIIPTSDNMQPVIKNGWAFTGNYSLIEAAADGLATDLFLLNTSSAGFGRGVETSYVPAFRAYLEDVSASGDRSEAKQLSLVIEGTTNIETSNVANAQLTFSSYNGILVINAMSAHEVSVYSIAGNRVKQISLIAGDNTITDLPVGLYIINNQKIIIK